MVAIARYLTLVAIARYLTMVEIARYLMYQLNYRDHQINYETTINGHRENR